MIRFACPKCLDIYEVSPDRAGESFNCRKCGKNIKAPSRGIRVADDDEPPVRRRSGLIVSLSDIAGVVLLVGGLFGLLVSVLITLSSWSSEGLLGVIVGVGWTISSLLILGFAMKMLRTK